MLALLLVLAQAAPATAPSPAPVVETDPAYTVGAGAIVSVPNDTATQIEPIIRVAADVPMPIGNVGDNWLPHAHFALDLTSQSADLTTTGIGQVKSVEFSGGLAFPVSREVYKRYRTYIYGRAGFATLSSTALYSVPKYVNGGLRMEDHVGNAYIEIGAGVDQRVTNSAYYSPAVTIKGQIPLKSIGALNTYLVGDAVLTLQNQIVNPLYKSTNQVRVGILVGK